MMFKNSVRLLLTNFSTVWKLLLYYCICFIITVAVCVPVLGPIISKFTAAGVFVEINNVFTYLFRDSAQVILSFNNAIDGIASVLTINAGAFVWNYVGFAFIALLFAPFIFGLADLAVCETIYGSMSSNTRYGFTASLIKHFGRSVTLQLVKLITIVPINLVIMAAFVGIIKLLVAGGILNIFGSFMVLLLILIAIAVKQAIFSAWIPAMVVRGYGPFKALKKGVQLSNRNFLRIFSTSLAFVFANMVFNIFFGLFSFGTCLFITIPLSVLITFIFYMVSYFTTCGMRYYVYPDLVVSPITLEQSDRLDKTKYLL